MAGQMSADKSVPQIYLQPHSTASDDLDRLSTAGNVGLLRSMSARTVDSLPGVDSSHNSSCSGSRYFLSPVPGGAGDIGGLGGVEPMTARSTSCPSMSYQHTIPHAYHPFNKSNRENNDDDDDINLEGEVITDLPVEPTRLFPDLLPQLDLQLDETDGGGMYRQCDNGNVANPPYDFSSPPLPSTSSLHHQHSHHLQNSAGSHHQNQQQQNSRLSGDPEQEESAVFGDGHAESFPVQFNQSQHPPQLSQQHHHKTRDYGTNPEVVHHRQGAPVFAQSHSHTHRAVSRSNGCHGDIPEYHYIRYHRQTTKDTESSVDARRSYHRQSTKDSATSTGRGGGGGGGGEGGEGDIGGYSGARRSGRRRSGKHGSTSSSSQRHSTSSQTSDPLPAASSAVSPGKATHPAMDGGGRAPDRVINIRDLPSNVAREVIAEKAHVDSNFNVDVQEKCMRWLSSLHVSVVHDS